MCQKCGKSKCCCPKVISKQGLKGPKGDKGPVGPRGPMGPGIAQFIVIEAAPEDVISNFDSSPVTEAGDYVVALEANVEQVGVSDISFNSFFRKNGVADSLNINYQHLNRTSGVNCTHTHTAKVTLAVGQTAGFQLAMSSSAKVLNGSIVLSKIQD